MAKGQTRLKRQIVRFTRSSAGLIFMAGFVVIIGAAIYLSRITNAVDVAPTQAKMADSFVDSIGVNVDIREATGKSSDGSTISDLFGTIVKPRLQEMHIRHIRDGMAETGTGSNGVIAHITRLNSLANSQTAGLPRIIPLLKVTDNGSSSDPTSSCFIPKIKIYIQGGKVPCGDAVGMSVGSNIPLAEIELTNEPDHCPTWRGYPCDSSAFNWYQKINSIDPTWRSDTLRVGKALRPALDSDAVTRPLKVVGPSYVHIGDNPTYKQVAVSSSQTLFQEQGGLVPFVNYGNIHTYCGKPECTSSYPPVSEFFANKPLVETEFGFSTSEYTDLQQDKLIARSFFARFDRGIKQSYLYFLRDDPTRATAKERSFGVLRADGTPKGSFKTIRNMIYMLEDPGAAFTPGTLKYTLSGDTSSLRTTLLQKRDGSFYLIFRQEPATTTDADYSKSLTINFGQPISKAELYHPHTALGLIRSYTAPSSVSLTIPDRIIILKVVPGASTTPPPTPTPTITAPPSGKTPTPPPATPTAPTDPVEASLHVGNLSFAAITSGSKWKSAVTVTVYNGKEKGMSGVKVSGSWSRGTATAVSCVTNASGQCTMSSSELNTSQTVVFSVTNLERSGYTYVSKDNHDPDNDTNGSTVTIKPRR